MECDQGDFWLQTQLLLIFFLRRPNVSCLSIGHIECELLKNTCISVPYIVKFNSIMSISVSFVRKKNNFLFILSVIQCNGRIFQAFWISNILLFVAYNGIITGFLVWALLQLTSLKILLSFYVFEDQPVIFFFPNYTYKTRKPNFCHENLRIQREYNNYRSFFYAILFWWILFCECSFWMMIIIDLVRQASWELNFISI